MTPSTPPSTRPINIPAATSTGAPPVVPARVSRNLRRRRGRPPRHESCYRSTSLSGIGRWTLSLGVRSFDSESFVCRQIANSEVSSYRSSLLLRKAASPEPRSASVSEASCTCRFRLQQRQRVLCRKPAALEVGADVRVAVTALGEAFGPRCRCPRVIEVAKALEVVECPEALLVREAALLEACIELRPGAVGGAEGAKCDVLGSWLSL